MPEWIQPIINMLGAISLVLSPILSYAIAKRKLSTNYQTLFIKSQNEFVTSMIKDNEIFRASLMKELAETKSEVKLYKDENEKLNKKIDDLKDQIEALIVINNELNDTNEKYQFKLTVQEDQILVLEKERNDYLQEILIKQARIEELERYVTENRS